MCRRLAAALVFGAMSLTACGGGFTAEPPDGTGMATLAIDGPGDFTPIDMEVEPRRTQVGGIVSVESSGWTRGEPVTLYLITREELGTGAADYREAEKIELDIVLPDDGRVDLEFEMLEGYETDMGNYLEMRPGVVLQVVLAQGFGRVRGTGPLTVE